MSLPGVDSVTSLLNSFLDVQSQRAETVAGNLANSETPGYRAREVDFKDYLRRAAEESLTGQSNAQATLANAPRVIEQSSGAIGIDGNTVDVGHETSTLAEAGMSYQTGVQLLQSRLRTLRAAIREGR